MDMIFFLLAFISLIALLIGLFSPEKSLFWFGGERTRMLSAKVYATSFGVCFLIFIWYMPKNQTALETAKNATDTTNKQVEKVADVDTSTIKMPEGVKKFAKELKENAKNQPQDNSTSNSQNQVPYFEGVTAADIYSAFENLGFSKKIFKGTELIEYHLEQSTPDHQLLVDVVGVETDKIDRVRGTVLIYSGETNQTTTKFLAMVASVKYKNARPQEAYNWVLANIANQNSTTTIGGISFTLLNNGTNKMLTIEPAS